MINTSKTLVFFGNERLVSGLASTDAPVLTGLIDSGYTIAAIVSHHSDGHSRNNRPLEVAEIAKKHSIPLLLPNKPSEIREQLLALGAEAAILVAYGRIIPQSIIDIFPKGIINIHPSLLPAYRGSTPIESAIANGDATTGVSIMQLTAGMDEGPVFAQTTIQLEGNETKFKLYKTLANKSAAALLDTLPAILDGSLKATPQDDSRATYSSLLTKKECRLDPTQYTAIQAERRIRAHLGYPKSKLTLLGHDSVITKAHVSNTKETPIDVVFADGLFLCVDELIAPSGRRMNVHDFLRGYQN